MAPDGNSVLVSFPAPEEPRSKRRSLERHVNRSISDITAEASALAVEKVQCECCGMSEECTPAYISKVKGHFNGKWICGLCADDVTEKASKMGSATSTEDALSAHMSVCVKFNKFARPNPALYLADTMRELLRKKGSRTNGPNPRPPRNGMSRTTSCIPAFTKD